MRYKVGDKVEIIALGSHGFEIGDLVNLKDQDSKTRSWEAWNEYGCWMVAESEFKHTLTIMSEVIIQVPEGHELVQDGNTYTIKEKSKYPTSWEGLGVVKGFFIGGGADLIDWTGIPTPSNRNIYATKEQAEASIAQAQITQLLKAYNGDWKADWTDGTNKFVIYMDYEEWRATSIPSEKTFLSFKTSEARDHFFEHHMDLLNKYKPLAG